MVAIKSKISSEKGIRAWLRRRHRYALVPLSPWPVVWLAVPEPTQSGRGADDGRAARSSSRDSPVRFLRLSREPSGAACGFRVGGGAR